MTLSVYTTDLFIPRYRPMETSRWKLHLAEAVLCPGYWSETQLVVGMAGLIRVDGDSRETWMSMTPMEIESQEIGCRAATGHTVVMGMGMGWAAANAALRPEVTAVTVVELDPEVIGLVADTGIFEQLPPDVAAKIRVENADALSYVPERPADTLLADIWRPLNGDGRVEQVRRMHANTGAARVYYWGQEMSIARRARAEGIAVDADTLPRLVTAIGLPLIGPERPDYPELVTRAAARWLKD